MRKRLSQGQVNVKNLIERGYEFDGSTYWPPNSAQAIAIRESRSNKKLGNRRAKHLKTGWIDDTRNIENKQKHVDMFIRLVKQVLQLDVWPEFFFLTGREYRFDYAIPLGPVAGTKLEDHYTEAPPAVKIAIEQEGGVWAKGNSGHSSGTGIMRDMDKGSLASVNGWILIRRTPDQLCTNETLQLIKKAIESRRDLK